MLLLRPATRLQAEACLCYRRLGNRPRQTTSGRLQPSPRKRIPWASGAGTRFQPRRQRSSATGSVLAAISARLKASQSYLRSGCPLIKSRKLPSAALTTSSLRRLRSPLLQDVLNSASRDRVPLEHCASLPPAVQVVPQGEAKASSLRALAHNFYKGQAVETDPNTAAADPVGPRRVGPHWSALLQLPDQQQSRAGCI